MNNLRKTVLWSAVMIANIIEWHARYPENGFLSAIIVILSMCMAFWYGWFSKDE